MPEYVTVFQVSKESPNWLPVFVGFVPLLAGCLLLIGKLLFPWQRMSWFYPIGVCLFGLVWIYLTPNDVDSKAWLAFENLEYSRVEGVVTNFHPMPYEGHDDECFSVQLKRFCYSDYGVTPGFHHTASHGGPIRPGVHVRIAYIGSTILRLEMAKADVRARGEYTAAADSARRESIARMENDPIQQRITTAFLFTIVILALWWNIQWRRSMGIWLRPPYRAVTQDIFRAFFAIGLISAVAELLRNLLVHPLTWQTIGPTVVTAAAMCAVVSAFNAVALRRADRRARRATGDRLGR